MKKLLVLSCVMLMACLAFGQKFGYLNSAEVLLQMPDIKAADSDLEGFRKVKMTQGQKMAQDLQAKAQKLQEDYEVKGILSAKEYQEQGAALQAEQEKIAQFEQDMYRELATKKESLYAPILNKVNTAINDVSKENGYTMIFDSNTGILLFAEESMDVTDLVMAKLGITRQKPASTVESAPAPAGN